MQPDISPLAKRLAEENNVEWQGLFGSGSDGRIVERDVLEYLARVMAGEENVNPTPEPLPAGMEAWPEEAATQSAAAPKSVQPPAQETINIDSIVGELTTDEPLLDTDSSFGSAPRVEINRAATQGELEDAINDDIFLFDDFGDDSAANDGEETAYDPEDAAEAAPDRPTDEATPGESVLTSNDSGDFPADLNVSFDVADTATETLEPTAEPTTEPDFSFDEDFGTEPAAPTAFGVQNGLDQDDTDLQGDDELDVLSLAISEVPTPTEDVALFDAGSVASADAEDEMSLFLTEADTLEESAGEEASASSLADDAFTLDEPAHRNASADESEASQEKTLQESPTETASRQTSNDSENGSEQHASMPPASAPVAGGAGSSASASAAPAHLVSYGLLLRRHVDLTQLMQAQVAIGQEVGQPGAVGPSSLLLRAAAKALATAPLNDHDTVGLAVFGQAVQIAAVPDILTRPFKEIVAAAAQPDTTTPGTTFGVIVADISELDIDEAVLNAGAPVLTLGRILQDSGEGVQHSTLALSGDLTVEQGTKFLAAVARLLDSPIRLVV